MPFLWSQADARDPVQAPHSQLARLHVGIKPTDAMESKMSHEVFMDVSPMLADPDMTPDKLRAMIRERGERFCALLTWLEANGTALKVRPQEPGRIFAAQSNGMTVLNLALEPFLFDGHELQFSLFNRTSLQHEHHVQLPYPTTDGEYTKLQDMYEAHRRAPSPETWIDRWNEKNPEYPARLDRNGDYPVVILALGDRGYEVDIDMNGQWAISPGKVSGPYLTRLIPVFQALADFSVGAPKVRAPVEEPQAATVEVELV